MQEINYGVELNEANFDKGMTPGWYRFKFDDRPYAKIPTTVPKEEHRQRDMQSCGTHGVSWMPASLPTIGEPAKEIAINFAFHNMEKLRSITGKVVACGEGGNTVYLYYLAAASACDDGYCAL